MLIYAVRPEDVDGGEDGYLYLYVRGTHSPDEMHLLTVSQAAFRDPEIQRVTGERLGYAAWETDLGWAEKSINQWLVQNLRCVPIDSTALEEQCETRAALDRIRRRYGKEALHQVKQLVTHALPVPSPRQSG